MAKDFVVKVKNKNIMICFMVVVSVFYLSYIDF